MAPQASDASFAGSIPQVYDRLLVPLIFEPYAEDLAARAAALEPARVLEVAAGTGVVTRAMARRLAAHTEVVATDLNPAMLARAAEVGTVRPVRPVQWLCADAMRLPFEDGHFDALVCQFGVMFFPDKVHAFAEARRVLRPGGVLLFNVWDRIETSEFADTVTRALAELFPADPPRFLARTPHGYFERGTILRDLALAGWTSAPSVETIAHRSRAASPDVPAAAYCQGTPLRNEIEARAGAGLVAATQACTAAIARQFGDGAVDGRIQAHVITARR